MPSNSELPQQSAKDKVHVNIPAALCTVADLHHETLFGSMDARSSQHQSHAPTALESSALLHKVGKSG